jgi:hypothetical protein
LKLNFTGIISGILINNQQMVLIQQIKKNQDDQLNKKHKSLQNTKLNKTNITSWKNIQGKCK